MRMAATLGIALAALAVCAAPALAGETAEGRGWELEVPAGFTEASNMEGGGEFNVASHFSTLPIERVAEIRAYVVGGAQEPTAVLVISRVDLVTPVTTTEDMGLDRLSATRGQLPAGARIDATNVGEWNAIEMSFRSERGWDPTTMRMLVVAAGEYCVAVMLLTKDEAHPQSEAMWAELRGSLQVEPPVNRWLLFGLVGIGALGAMWVLGRFGSRQVREIPEHEGRFTNRDGSEIGSLAAHKPMQTGVRPKVLSSEPRRDAAGGADLGAPPPRPKPTPMPRQTEPARPAVKSAATPNGLRATRPSSGRWGE